MTTVEVYGYKNRLWEITIEYSNHSQMRWMDRRVPAKTLRSMTLYALRFFLHNRILRAKRIIVQHTVKKVSMVITRVKFELKEARMKLLVITVLHKLMKPAEGETIIEIYKNRRWKVYEYRNGRKYEQLDYHIPKEEPYDEKKKACN